MRLFSTRFFTAAALFYASAAAAFSPAELTAQLQKPQNVQGVFTQERHLRSLAKPMNTQGIFAIKPKSGLYWQIDKPLSLRLRVNRQGIAQWDSKKQRWQNSPQGGQAAQVKLFMAVLGGDIGALEQQFTPKLSGSAQKWQLDLQPKTAVMKQVFQSIRINGGRHVERVELLETQGDKTVMQFSGQRTDQALPAAAEQALP